MTRPRNHPALPGQEHSVPWFWPFAAPIELATEGLRLFGDNLKYAAEAYAIAAPPPPEWATKNHVLLDLHTLVLRDFSSATVVGRGTPVLIDAPYAGHSATIADYAEGQSLVETLLSCGLEHVLVTDWKSATEEMKDFDIDTYLAEMNVVVDTVGGRVHLIGVCQGGWMSAMFAARFPHKVSSLVLAGAPIDTDAGDGAIKKIAHQLPMSFFQAMVASGSGRMLGRFMLAGWKNMHAGEQYMNKYLDLYAHIKDRCYIERTERFERWYENPLDLPGRWYLQAIEQLFKENRLAKGEFIALGQRISLHDITTPVYLLAGAADDITTKEQVFNAAKLVGTPAGRIVSQVAPGGHLGLFMGSRTLREIWPHIAAWIKRLSHRKK